jgi:hypothetical protein
MSAIVIGVVTRTGSAVAIALSGPAAAPRFRAAGRPWRHLEKDATRAALTLLTAIEEAR